MKTVTLNIEGMTCGGCVNSVTRVLEAIEGVEKVQVDLASGRAVINIAEGKTDTTQLIEAIENAGFDASLPA
ncbi:heavy-metal-associated domain-containing protein [Neisseria sp. S1]|uniref:heavy-metal-associated domain-containing protein n=1 Tax=Neisseria sp. S1 TaxID=3318354 RepID=UPI003A8A03A3